MVLKIQKICPPGSYFTIPQVEVIKSLSRGTVEFYGRSGYLDLMAGDLNVATRLLHVNDAVRSHCKSHDISVGASRGSLLDNISYDEAVTIVHGMDKRLPTAALMFRVIIPYLSATTPTAQSYAAISRMQEQSGEFLEGILAVDLGKSPQLRLGTGKIPLHLPHKVEAGSKFREYHVRGTFGPEDITDEGFPSRLNSSAVFDYFGPNDFSKPIGKELYPFGGGPQGEVVAILQHGERLGLNLLFTRTDIQDNLGLRLVWVEKKRRRDEE